MEVPGGAEDEAPTAGHLVGQQAGLHVASAYTGAWNVSAPRTKPATVRIDLLDMSRDSCCHCGSGQTFSGPPDPSRHGVPDASRSGARPFSSCRGFRTDYRFRVFVEAGTLHRSP